MALVDKLYDWLARGPTPDADSILAAGLGSAEPEYFDRIASILIERGHVASWAGLIEHYDRLTLEARTRVLAAEERVRDGAALAFRSADPDARHNAMLALEDQPTPKLAYLMSTALRDSSGKVRDAAARVFRKTAQLTASQNDLSDVDATAKDRAADRAQLVQAVREVVRTFDRHHRVELLEACLWFAPDLGDELWEQLENNRSRIGRVVIEHLEEWSHPRLAGFLLMALGRPDWRSAAAHVLRSWKDASAFLTLLRFTSVAENAAVQPALAVIRRPEWFARMDSQMSRVPEALRARVPWWICRLGLTNEDKINFLSRWLTSLDKAVSRAVVYALAVLDVQQALTHLRQVADSRSPNATFARWYLAGRGCAPIRAVVPVSSSAIPTPSPSPDSTEQGDSFAVEWQRCRRATADERAPIVARIRANIEHWWPGLIAQLRSADPRDRILVIQIIDTRELMARYGEELRPLLEDPVPSIRKIAAKLFATLADPVEQS